MFIGNRLLEIIFELFFTLFAINWTRKGEKEELSKYRTKERANLLLLRSDFFSLCVQCTLYIYSPRGKPRCCPPRSGCSTVEPPRTSACTHVPAQSRPLALCPDRTESSISGVCCSRSSDRSPAHWPCTAWPGSFCRSTRSRASVDRPTAFAPEVSLFEILFDDRKKNQHEFALEFDRRMTQLGSSVALVHNVNHICLHARLRCENSSARYLHQSKDTASIVNVFLLNKFLFPSFSTGLIIGLP